MFSEQGILLSEAWGICQEDQWAREEEKCGQGKSMPESGFCPFMFLRSLTSYFIKPCFSLVRSSPQLKMFIFKGSNIENNSWALILSIYSCVAFTLYPSGKKKLNSQLQITKSKKALG